MKWSIIYNVWPAMPILRVMLYFISYSQCLWFRLMIKKSQNFVFAKTTLLLNLEADGTADKLAFLQYGPRTATVTGILIQWRIEDVCSNKFKLKYTSIAWI